MTIDTAAERAKLEALAGFTPGPWGVERDECHFSTLSNVVGGKRFADGKPRPYPLMVSVGGRNKWQEQEATTRAIAATPDTIASLSASLDEIDALRAALRLWVPLAEAAGREEVTYCADWDAALEATKALL